VGVNVAASLEVGDWQAPGGRIRSAGQVGRLSASRPEPDLDSSRGPLHGKDTASVCVEAGTVRLASPVLDLAADTADAVVAVGGAELTGQGHGAAVVGVESHVILSLVMDTFENVNLAFIGPVGADRPAVSCQYGVLCLCTLERIVLNLQRWPGTTNTSRHMLKIKNHERMIVDLVADDSHARTALGARNTRVINTDVDLVLWVNADKALGLSSSLIDILDISMSRVTLGIKPKVVEEVVALVVVLQGIIDGVGEAHVYGQKKNRERNGRKHICCKENECKEKKRSD
jgi:hypothetical protein